MQHFLTEINAAFSVRHKRCWSLLGSGAYSTRLSGRNGNLGSPGQLRGPQATAPASSTTGVIGAEGRITAIAKQCDAVAGR